MDDLMSIMMCKFTIPLEFPSADELKAALDGGRERILAYEYPNGTVLAVLVDSADVMSLVRNYLDSKEWIYEENFCDLWDDGDMLEAVRQLQGEHYGEQLDDKDNS